MGTINYISKPAHANSYSKNRKGAIQSIILHASCGREASDIPVLRGEDSTHLVSAHWYVDRVGKIFHLVDNKDTAWHVGAASEVKFSNACSIGVEQEHLDGQEDWPDVQIKATAALCVALAQRYGPLTIAHHSSVAVPPGRKTDPVSYPSEVFWPYWSDATGSQWDFAEVKE